MRALLYAILLVLVGTGHADQWEMKKFCSIGYENMLNDDHEYVCVRCSIGFYKDTVGTYLGLE
jgi:hypothetical protein